MSGCSPSPAAPAIPRRLSIPFRPAAAATPALLCLGLAGGGACLSFELVSGKPWKEVRRRKQRCSPGSEVSCGFIAEPALELGFVVVNFYKFVFVEDPGEEVAKHLAFLQVTLDSHLPYVLWWFIMCRFASWLLRDVCVHWSLHWAVLFW